jgi:hypothetical protein
VRRLFRILLSLLLSFITLALISTINHLPYSSTRDATTDVLSFPGGLIAWLFYPGGVHGGYATRWASVAIGGNFLFYALFWYVTLYSVHAFKKRQKLKAVH